MERKLFIRFNKEIGRCGKVHSTSEKVEYCVEALIHITSSLVGRYEKAKRKDYFLDIIGEEILKGDAFRDSRPGGLLSQARPGALESVLLTEGERIKATHLPSSSTFSLRKGLRPSGPYNGVKVTQDCALTNEFDSSHVPPTYEHSEVLHSMSDRISADPGCHRYTIHHAPHLPHVSTHMERNLT